MAKVVQQVFKRVEKKYLLSDMQYNELVSILMQHMRQDEYGLYTICNIYYDTDDFELIRTSIEKPTYKEKFRIRSYGVANDDSTVFLEIKKKCKGVVYKRRIPVKKKEAMEILSEIDNGNELYGNVTMGCDDDDQKYEALKSINNRQIMHEIEYVIKHYNLSPKTYIAYDRVALFGIEESDLRITFDQNIRTREYDLDLSSGDYGDRLLDEGLYIMEIKTNGAMPMWLVKTLSEMQIYPYSFSKYGNAYKRKLLEV